jgi:hypothetical protein
MEVVKMVATKMESIKPQKLATVKKFFRSAWWITKTFVKISPLVAAPLFAQQKDSAKVADEAFFKPSLAAKAYVREFAGGKDVGAGLGVQAGVKWQMLSCKGALSLAKDSSCVKGDGFNVSVSGTTGVFTNSVYVDNDPLIRPTAVYGISTSAYGALVKIHWRGCKLYLQQHEPWCNCQLWGWEKRRSRRAENNCQGRGKLLDCKQCNWQH